MSSRKRKGNVALSPMRTRSATKEAPVAGKRCKNVTVTTSLKRSRGAKPKARKASNTSANKNNSSALKTSGSTFTSTAVNKTILPTLRRSRSATNVGKTLQLGQSSLTVPRTRSAVNINTPMKNPSRPSNVMSANISAKRALAATATLTTRDRSGNGPMLVGTPFHTPHGNERRFLDLSSNGVPIVISVQRDLFDHAPYARRTASQTSDGSETRTRVPTTETSGGNQRRFILGTAAGVPLGVSVLNATSRGQTPAIARGVDNLETSSLRDRIGFCRRPVTVPAAGRPSPTARPSLRERILLGQDYDDDYKEVDIGPPWGSTLFHDEVTGLQSVIHICPLCVTVRRLNYLDNINVRPLKMGESRQHFKLRMVMLVGQSPPKWLKDLPGPMLGGDRNDDCSILCWLVYDNMHKDKITTLTVWKQLAATWPALMGTNTRVLPRRPRSGQQQPVIELPDPSNLDAAYARIMAAVSHQLNSFLS